MAYSREILGRMLAELEKFMIITDFQNHHMSFGRNGKVLTGVDLEEHFFKGMKGDVQTRQKKVNKEVHDLLVKRINAVLAQDGDSFDIELGFKDNRAADTKEACVDVLFGLVHRAAEISKKIDDDLRVKDNAVREIVYQIPDVGETKQTIVPRAHNDSPRKVLGQLSRVEFRWDDGENRLYVDCPNQNVVNILQPIFVEAGVLGAPGSDVICKLNLLMSKMGSLTDGASQSLDELDELQSEVFKSLGDIKPQKGIKVNPEYVASMKAAINKIGMGGADSPLVVAFGSGFLNLTFRHQGFEKTMSMEKKDARKALKDSKGGSNKDLTRAAVRDLIKKGILERLNKGGSIITEDSTAIDRVVHAMLISMQVGEYRSGMVQDVKGAEPVSGVSWADIVRRSVPVRAAVLPVQNVGPSLDQEPAPVTPVDTVQNVVDNEPDLSLALAFIEHLKTQGYSGEINGYEWRFDDGFELVGKNNKRLGNLRVLNKYLEDTRNKDSLYSAYNQGISDTPGNFALIVPSVLNDNPAVTVPGESDGVDPGHELGIQVVVERFAEHQERPKGKHDGQSLSCWQSFKLGLFKLLRSLAKGLGIDRLVEWTDKKIHEIDPSHNVKGHDDPGPNLAASA